MVFHSVFFFKQVYSFFKYETKAWVSFIKLLLCAMHWTKHLTLYLHDNPSSRYYDLQFTYNAIISWDDPSFWDTYKLGVKLHLWKTDAGPTISKTCLGTYFLMVSPASKLLPLKNGFSLVIVWSFHILPFPFHSTLNIRPFP